MSSQSPIYFYTKTDPYFELSNFYPQGFEKDGQYWPTVEHYFQAQKFGDADYRERVRRAPTARAAKILGRDRSRPIHANWDSIRTDVMRYAVKRKFEHPRLKNILIGTGNAELIENSPFDSYWGCGPAGDGSNMLGIILMEVRSQYRSEQKQVLHNDNLQG